MVMCMESGKPQAQNLRAAEESMYFSSGRRGTGGGSSGYQCCLHWGSHLQITNRTCPRSRARGNGKEAPAKQTRRQPVPWEAEAAAWGHPQWWHIVGLQIKCFLDWGKKQVSLRYLQYMKIQLPIYTLPRIWEWIPSANETSVCFFMCCLN